MTDSNVKAYNAKQEDQAEKFMRFMSNVQAWVFKKTNGYLFNTFFLLAPVGILTTKGRKSGEWREASLVYGKIDGKIIIIASKAGLSTHPLWYLNLKVNPDCKMQTRGNPVNMRAREAEGEEKDYYWNKMLTVYKGFNAYRARANNASGRAVPLLVLEPVN
jgi:deazaflavin-dependent oxidoreductase (nitroreductase family)